jgi:hypothetical protein
MQILGIVEFSPALFCAKNALGQSVSITIAGVEGFLAIPSLPEWSKDDKDPLRQKLVSPPEVKTWKSGEHPILWGKPVRYPSGHSQVEKAVLKFDLESENEENTGQKIYEVFPHWLNLFKQYIQLFTTQYTMGERNIVIDQYENLTLFKSQNDKFEVISNLQYDSLTIEIGGKDTSVHLEHLQEACRLASLLAEPRLEYALLLDAYSAHAVGDYRKAIIESAASLEIGLTSRIIQEFKPRNIDFGEHLLNKYKTLGGRLELAQILKIIQPDPDYRMLIVGKRNSVIHDGVAPDRKTAKAALEKVSTLLNLLSPIIHQTI